MTRNMKHVTRNILQERSNGNRQNKFLLCDTCYVIHEQRGSTLILTVLVMATMLTSMYIMANISVRGIRQIFASVSGEQALLAADAALEHGLWAHLREQGTVNGNCEQTPAEYEAFALSGSLSDMSVKHCRSTLITNPSDIILVPDDQSTAAREDLKEIYVTDPTNPDGPSNYSEVTFAWQAGSGNVKVCLWSVPDCDTGPWLANFLQSSQSLPTTVLLNTADDRYVIWLAGGPTGYTVMLSAEDESCNRKGLPAEGVTVKGYVQDSNVTRWLDV